MSPHPQEDRADLRRHVAWRLKRFVRPAITVVDPPDDIRVERDVEVPLRDGVVMRVNVFRPKGDHEPRPVIASAHPYGKDALPRRRRRGSGYALPFQTRMLPQSRAYTVSAFTTWEAPDPAVWVAHGYVVVNADLRGWGRSDGLGELLSEQEGLDVHDLVEWAARQPWSTGRVGLLGVSYLALSQWAGAATRPPHLAAICPWEGFTDLYRDFGRPGGIREDGFSRMWSIMMKRQRRSPVTLRRELVARPYLDEWYAARDRDIERIDVPALVCGSFSDHNLHSRGSFEGYQRIASTQKWLYTHRGPKWSTFYSPEAVDFQKRFFDHFLRDDEPGFADEPRVRIEIREDADTVADVRHESRWPPPSATVRILHLDAAGRLSAEPVASTGTCEVDGDRASATFTWTVDEQVDLVGPMVLHLYVRAVDADDLLLFAGIRKRRAGRIVGFEGSYGFPRALVTVGWLKASHRLLDPAHSRPDQPSHDHRATAVQPLVAGEVVPVDIALLPSATRFRPGEQLELVVQGRWFFPRNPLVGQFPISYERQRTGRGVIHCGGDTTSTLTVPVLR